MNTDSVELTGEDRMLLSPHWHICVYAKTKANKSTNVTAGKVTFQNVDSIKKLHCYCIL